MFSHFEVLYEIPEGKNVGNATCQITGTDGVERQGSADVDR